MTTNKAEKRAIRDRMTKTGERYTTARRYLPKDQRETPTTQADATGAGAASDSSRVVDLGMSDDAIRRGSGKPWDEWFRLLDDWGAATRAHAEIAQYISAHHDVGGWWAQTVTVGYERARGLRAKHQRPNGFSVSVSKTFPVPVDRLFAAFVEESARDTWLEPGSLSLRTTRPSRSARFDVLVNDSRIAVYFIAKSEATSTAQLQHEQLATADDVEEWRGFWKASLERLAVVLKGGS